MGLTDFFKKKEPEHDITGIDVATNAFDTQNSAFGNSNSFQNNDFMNNQSMGQTNSFSQANQAFASQGMGGGGSELQKDIQMISLKLDAIKSELDSMNQRLKAIEIIAEKEQTHQKTKKWY